MSYLRRAWVEIDLQAIAKNYDSLCRIAKTQVIPVVKADAYGHGAVKIAQVLNEKSVVLFGVSNLDEALELRLAGFTSDILILGYTPPSCAEILAENNIIQAVFSTDFARELNEFAQKANVKIKSHIKLDTGMGRIGFNAENELAQVVAAASFKNLEIQGIFTHFSCAESSNAEDIAYTKNQYDSFLKAIEFLENKGLSFKMKHCSNSSALLTNDTMVMDAVRTGILLYGLTPSSDFSLAEISPAMSFYSVVAMVKEVEDGSCLSYGRTHKTAGKRKIATVSAGYGDGVPRSLSNKGSVLINGKKAKIVGKVCMDQFLVDVTHIDDIKQSDKVTIFGKGLSVNEVAQNAGTINYEIICGISKRVPRIYK